MPEDLPPPVVPWTPVEDSAPAADEALEATGRMEPAKPELEIDPRELKALSRQERKEAKAALRREQQEKRNAARQAKAMAKAAAKVAAAREAAAAAPAVAPAAGEDDVAAEAGVAEETSEDVPQIAPDRPEAEESDVEAPESAEDESAEEAASPAPTDPRARAAQRVQRRLGKDAEKLTAAEARARAREEARRRRAQAKEERSGVVAEEVVRPPDEAAERNLAEDVSVVEPLTETEQTIEAELFDEEPPEAAAIEEPAIDEPVDEDVIEEPEADLPKPVIGQRIDEPAPVDEAERAIAEADQAIAEAEEPEPAVVEEPEPFAEPASVVETREGPRHAKTEPAMDEDEAPPRSRPSLAPIAGIVGLIALGISVLLAIGALLVALGFDSGGLYEALRTVANLLVGPLEGAFDFSGANAERKEHFLAWGAGSIGYLLISFVGQAVQRANDDQ